MLWNVSRAAEYVDEIDLAGDVVEISIHRFSEDLCNLGVIDGYRNYLEAGILHIFRYVEGRLACMRFGLYSDDGNGFCFSYEIRNL